MTSVARLGDGGSGAVLLDLLTQLGDAAETGQSRDVISSILNALCELSPRFLHPGGATGQAITDSLLSMRDRFRGGDYLAIDAQLLAFLRKGLTEHIVVADNTCGPSLGEAGSTGAGNNLQVPPGEMKGGCS